jgi:hypothetical protein
MQYSDYKSFATKIIKESKKTAIFFGAKRHTVIKEKIQGSLQAL